MTDEATDLPDDELTDTQKRAKEMVEFGTPMTQVALLLGVGERTVQRWKAEFGWERVKFLESPERRDAARAEALTRREWADRRREEANSAGLAAASLRNTLLKAAKEGNHQLVRSVSIAYGILIDKAEVITRTVEGGVTPVSASTKDERLGRITGHIDQLQARRIKKMEARSEDAAASQESVG